MASVDSEKALETRGVYARYGYVPALIDISLDVRKGEIVTLLGSNGAGKTTTLNVIYGFLPAVKGEILFQGQSIQGYSPQRLVSAGICYVPEGGKVFAPMTVMDNLELGSYSIRSKVNRRDIERNLANVFNLFPILKASRKRLAGTLSGGERQMLTLARAMMSSPRVLLLDEPSLGLAPMIITEVMRLIAKMKDKGLSVLLVEQNARAALRIADRGYVIEGGNITMAGAANQLLMDEKVQSAYLGGRRPLDQNAAREMPQPTAAELPYRVKGAPS
jgi:branched-chain amino acid transport system ATP-binding protein